MNHVIIGAGPAGVVAAETLRKLQPAASITLVGDEPEPPYSRMALPYFLINHIKEEGTHLRKQADHFAKQKIKVVHDRVLGLDRAAKLGLLASGSSIHYDKLLIATGSTPMAPPIPGIDLPGIFNCWTLADARNIATRAKPGAKVLLMGAGFIGCIILEALAQSGADLTVVEMADRMVPRMMNDIAGHLIKDWCEKEGVKVHTSTRVTAIRKGTPHAFAVDLSTGETVDADLIVSATGVRSNIKFLEGIGLETDQGILVNRHMQTNDPDIFAAGDVAQGRDFSTGEYSVQAIQPTATEHGQLAARNMAGLLGAVHRGSVNMNVLDTLGLISSSFGLWMGKAGGTSAELLNRERFKYMNLQFDGDILVGATSLGLTQHVGVLRGLIQTKTRLGKWKDKLLEDPTQIMEAYLASTQAVGFNAALMK
ncbi:MAG: NAD(P)/FAD-dependent oxidoreductase [Gammaproteobacteria bacterium]|nr:NAD(P)/FAD-dependent oxidoreductase [Gammaproteobacteria bacterium]